MTVGRGPERRGQDQRAPAFSDKAERRQLTLMFCDLVDSVGLSVRLDPEDLRDLIVAYQRACVAAVERYGGYVARYVGDGILVYFGYPVAHEDNAERAVRAALDLVAAVGELSAKEFPDLNVRVRVGIASGLVVVGSTEAPAGAGDVSDRNAVVGEAANLAARLQGFAEANTVVVSDATRRLAQEAFDYRDLGKHDMKGFTAPVSVYQVLGPREITRLEARGPALTSFVGRQEEIALLLDRFRRAAAGSGQVVALVGPAGMGKSRTVVEALGQIRAQTPPASLSLILQCSPYHSNTPLYPVIRALARLSGIEPQDPLAAKLDKVAKLPNFNAGNQQSVALIAELLGAELGLNHPTADLAPFVRRRLTIEALLDWLARSAAAAPAILVLEDVQWIDPTSRLLLARIGQWAQSGAQTGTRSGSKGAAILIPLTLRTERGGDADDFLKDTGLADPDGRHADHVTVREIRELNAADGRKLAAAAAASDGSTIGAAQLDAVIAKSGGVPLYLEQLVKAAAGGFDLLMRRTGTERVGTVPSTIDDALMAQLDRLGAAKEVAQHAAVIGPEFQLGLLARIMARSADELVPMLRDLEQSRIVEHGPSGENGQPDSYRFKHWLIHEISYRSLLRRNRRQIHLLVAGELSGHRAAEVGAANDDFIAQHFSLGDAPLQAIEFWRRGAGEAIARSANEEAIAMLESALAALGKVRGGVRPEMELDLVLTQTMALRSVRGYSAPEVEQGLLRARELAVACGDFASRFSVEWGLFQCLLVKGELMAARAQTAALVELAREEPGPATVDALLATGMAHWNAGEFAQSLAPLEAAAANCQPLSDQPRFLTHGQNAGLFALSYLSRAQCHLGLLDQGRATIERARSIAATRARDPGHVHSSLSVTIHAMRAYHLCGDLGAERQLAGEAVVLARANHYAYYEALATCHLGWVAGMEGDLEEGIAVLGEGIAALKETGTSISLAGYHLLLAQLQVAAGHHAEAGAALAIAAAAKGQAVWDSEIERVKGDMAASVDWSQAEAAYARSLDIARRQRAGLFVVKTAIGLARMLKARGRHKEGRQVLHECLAELSEGHDVAAFRAAREMLAGLTTGPSNGE